MNVMLRANLVTIPRPADADDTAVVLEGKVWRVCWWRDGRIPELFGPPFGNAREAVEASRFVRNTLGLGA